jgi:hypothetical protein
MKFNLKDNPFLYKLHYYFLKFFDGITLIIILLYILGIINSEPVEFIKFNFFLKIILGFYLIYRFNKFRKNPIEFTEIDRKICFSAGLFIIVISLADIIGDYVKNLQTKVNSYIKPINKNLDKKNVIIKSNE